jgi:hypothetical protein
MANRYRSDVVLKLGEEAWTLRLTLGALAEIETAFQTDDLVALGQRFETGKLSARDLIVVLGAAARGGGATVSDAALAAAVDVADLPEVAEAVSRLFANTFGSAGAA